MAKPNVNTFVPNTSQASSFSLLPCKPGSKIIVVGAGAFGGWTALSLLRKKFNVTLIDSRGPGNPKSSSGDETRVIRSTYGNNEIYFNLNVRALTHWKEFEKHCGQKLFFNKGVLWLCHEETNPLVDESLPFADKHQMKYEYLSPRDILERYPSLSVDKIHHAYLDAYGGYLKAGESCQLVVNTFIKEGGQYISTVATPGIINQKKLSSICLNDNTQLTADLFVFACGAWLGELFPDILKNVIVPSKQEVYYFGVPDGSVDLYKRLPVWVDVDGQDFYYGIPSNDGRVFKIGVDKRGETFDPENSDRSMNKDVLNKARNFISYRFPDLHNATLLQNRVCAYENSPDGNFIIDHHPKAENVIILGGGSGHGFKHGPAIGELVSEALTENRHIPGLFSLRRF